MTDARTDRDREWARRLAALPRSMAPRRDPWPEIAARIEASPTSGRRASSGRRWWPAAAAAAVVAAVGVWLSPGPGREHPPTSGVESRAPVPDAMWSAMAPPGRAGIEREYRAALVEIAALEPADWQSAAWRFDRHLEHGRAVMAGMEGELIAALRLDPGDPFINEWLMQLRARQVDLLKRIAFADMASRRQSI